MHRTEQAPLNKINEDTPYIFIRHKLLGMFSIKDIKTATKNIHETHQKVERTMEYVREKREDFRGD